MWLVSKPQGKLSFSTVEEEPLRKRPQLQPGNSRESLVFIPDGKDLGKIATGELKSPGKSVG